MSSKPKTIKSGRVRKIVPPATPGQPEKAEIVVKDAEPLYQEIRIENKLEDEQGRKVKLKPGAEVEVTVEADTKDTVPSNLSHKG
jgi:hypothetical protein